MIIRIDDLNGSEIAAFLNEHLMEMKSISPPESVHALDLEALRRPEITFWTVWDENTLVGSGALKELNVEHGEIKSMRTAAAFKKKGVASMLLTHILAEARNRGYRRLSLETGSMPFFEPARMLYSKFGFSICAPFSNYREDANSIFMTIEL
ncbi:MAG TPA: GNAT family N-acetyltransferase [Candidatus Hydrogenedentes bacterium]|nr:GNAT family N-acetyltransferase [Candidatus Hydrogenedentota bacterium]